MDSSLIENWNDVVTKQGRVFVLGDFSFYDKVKTNQILNKLNGTKYLIMGSHDKESINTYLNIGFKHVYNYPIIYDKFWMLFHEPLYVNSNMPYVNLFGHMHSCKEYTDFSEQSFCISIERINYTPIALNQIKEKISKNI